MWMLLQIYYKVVCNQTNHSTWYTVYQTCLKKKKHKTNWFGSVVQSRSKWSFSTANDNTVWKGLGKESKDENAREKIFYSLSDYRVSKLMRGKRIIHNQTEKHRRLGEDPGPSLSLSLSLSLCGRVSGLTLSAPGVSLLCNQIQFELHTAMPRCVLICCSICYAIFHFFFTSLLWIFHTDIYLCVCVRVYIY
jgi:hypothetical protein